MAINLLDRRVSLNDVLLELEIEDEVVFSDEKFVYNIFNSSSEDGWMYDIYDIKSCAKDEDGDYVLSSIEALDGGLCTGTAQNAIEMAIETSFESIRSKEQEHKTFKKNINLVDYDEFGFSNAITEISITEEKYFIFLEAYKNAIKGKIKSFDATDWFYCDTNKIYDYNEYLEEVEEAQCDVYSNNINIDFLPKHEAVCQYVTFEFNCEYKQLSIRILFKYASGSFDGDCILSLNELEDFFGKKELSTEDKSLDELDKDDLLFLIGEYNNYIVDFDYCEGCTPVCVYEFYNYEFQEIINKQEK